MANTIFEILQGLFIEDRKTIIPIQKRCGLATYLTQTEINLGTMLWQSSACQILAEINKVAN